MASAREVAEHLHKKEEELHEHWEYCVHPVKERIREVHEHLK